MPRRICSVASKERKKKADVKFVIVTNVCLWMDGRLVHLQCSIISYLLFLDTRIISYNQNNHSNVWIVRDPHYFSKLLPTRANFSESLHCVQPNTLLKFIPPSSTPALDNRGRIHQCHHCLLQSMGVAFR